MKKLLFILLFTLPYFGFSQQLPEKDPSDENVFIAVEVMPVFPGGPSAIMDYLNTNLKYPVDAKEKKIQGRVYVSFVVSEKGKVSGVKVLRGLSETIDAEAIRVINAMPDWIPGTQNGKAVKVSLNIPINFKLN